MNTLNDLTEQRPEEQARQPHRAGFGLLIAGVCAAIPPLTYTTLILVLGDEASTLPGWFLSLLMPFVSFGILLSPLSLAFAVFAMVRYRLSRVKTLATASLIWLAGAIAYGFAAYDFSRRLSDIWKLLPS
jgi:hypothetical protein